MRHLWVVLAIGCGSSEMPPTDPPDDDAFVSAAEDVALGITDPSALAVDATNVYFVHGGSTISRIAKAGGVIAPIASGLRGPGSLDASTDRLCWVNSGTHSADFLDGSVQCADAQITTAYMPSGLAIDGSTIYWVEIDGQRVRSIGTDGSSEQTLDTAPTHKTAVAISSTKLAWTATGVMDDVVVMDRATGVKTTLSSSEYSPQSIAIVDDEVYWLTVHALSDFLGALRVARNGTIVDLVVDELDPHALVRAGGSLYWTSDGRVRGISLAGGSAFTVVANRGRIGGLATDGTHLYWSETERGAIVRAPL